MKFDLLLVALLFAASALMWMAYVYFFKGSKNRIRIVLFEQVGNDKVYRGERIAFEEDDKKLGIYFMIKKEKKAISDIRNDDFFYDSKYNKALLLCKYAGDDYRVMNRLKDGEWFKRAIKLDEDGSPVVNAKTNEYELEETEYEECLGVTSTAREAMRFNKSFQKRMDEKMGEKLGFWEKFAPFITVGFVAIMLMISFNYMSGKTSETQMHIADTFVEGAGEYKAAITQPAFLEQKLREWEQKNAEDTAPIR